MGDLKKQHIISKTYLKHFSKNCDGREIFVIDRENPYEKGIQCRDSGESIFWEKNYSDSNAFGERKFVEKMFGQDIEPNYQKIIREISNENPRLPIAVKENLIQWIFFIKMRSPIWEPSVSTASKATRYNQQLHLENFTNETYFKAALDTFVKDVCSKRWTVYKSPKNKYWWTSDNPGYSLNIDKAEAGELLVPDPYCELSGAGNVVFYPLSKFYCLSIHAYDSGEDTSLNLFNTDLIYKQASDSLCKMINFYTLISQARLIISANRESLSDVEAINFLQT